MKRIYQSPKITIFCVNVEKHLLIASVEGSSYSLGISNDMASESDEARVKGASDNGNWADDWSW